MAFLTKLGSASHAVNKTVVMKCEAKSRGLNTNFCTILFQITLSCEFGGYSVALDTHLCEKQKSMAESE